MKEIVLSVCIVLYQLIAAYFATYELISIAIHFPRFANFGTGKVMSVVVNLLIGLYFGINFYNFELTSFYMVIFIPVISLWLGNLMGQVCCEQINSRK